MEKYLISLLEMNNRVIVPDLGAFIIRQQEPKELVFNDLLAFDDGMLTDRITQEENLSKAEARIRIRQFVEKIKKILNGDEPYHLENLGSLRMDISGKIEYSTTETEKEIPVKKDAIKKVATEANEEQPSEMPEEEKDVVDEIPEVPVEETLPGIEDAPVKESQKIQKDEEAVEESLPEPGVKGVPIVEPGVIQKEDKPVGEILPEPGIEDAQALGPQETAVEPVAGKVEPAGNRVEFILADGDVEVDVDATREEIPLEPDREEPPFSIDEAVEAEMPGKDRPVQATEGIVEETIKKEKEIAEKQEEAVETPGDESSGEPEPEPETELEPEPEPEPEEEPIRTEKPVSTYTQPYKSRKKAWPWIAGLAALLVFLLAATWFMFPEMVDSILRKTVAEVVVEKEPVYSKSGTEIPPVREPEGTDKEAEKTLETVPDETSGTRKPVPAVQPAGKQYYVVAGCFEELKNAEDYVRTLRDKGYDASVFGMRKNLHAVCFNAHLSKQAAIEELHQIQDRFDPNAWVLYY